MFTFAGCRVACSSLVLFAVALTPTAAWADIPPPPGPEVQAKLAGAPFEVTVQGADKPLRLEIPRDFIAKEMGEKPAGIFGGFDALRTIVAGTAMSLAVIVGGLWLVRRFEMASGKPLPRAATAATVAVLVVAGLAVATAWGDGLLPGEKRPRPVPVRPVEVGGLRVQVVVVEKGEKVVLHASAADLRKITAGRGFPGFPRGGFGAPPASAPPAAVPVP